MDEDQVEVSHLSITGTSSSWALLRGPVSAQLPSPTLDPSVPPNLWIFMAQGWVAGSWKLPILAACSGPASWARIPQGDPVPCL